MGNGARIEGVQLEGGIAAGYTHRPSLLGEEDRLSLDGAIGINLNTFVDDNRSFRIFLGIMGGREFQPQEGVGFDEGSGDAAHVGAMVGAYFGAYPPVLYVGADVNPRATWFDGNDIPQFEIAANLRAVATFGHFLASFSIGGILNVEEPSRSGFQTSLAALFNL